MDKIIVLGTGHAVVKNIYNTCFAMQKGNEYLLVDAGGGSQILSHLEKMNISLQNIHHIFVSHNHTDHVLGIIWVLRIITSMMKGNHYQGNLYIYGHDEVIDGIKTMCEITLQKALTSLFGNRVIFVEVKDGDQHQFMDDTFTFFDIHSTKMKQFGFVIQDASITFAGDEPYNELCDQYTMGTKMLLHEAFCLYRDKDIYKPYEKHHSTALDAGKIASKLGAKQLVLWHSEEDTYENKKELYTKEAQDAFDGEIFVPQDLEIITLKKEAE